MIETYETGHLTFWYAREQACLLENDDLRSLDSDLLFICVVVFISIINHFSLSGTLEYCNRTLPHG